MTADTAAVFTDGTGILIGERGIPGFAGRVLSYAKSRNCNKGIPCFDNEGDFIFTANAIDYVSAPTTLTGPLGATANFGAAFARSGDLILVGDVAPSPASATGTAYVLQPQYTTIQNPPPQPSTSALSGWQATAKLLGSGSGFGRRLYFEGRSAIAATPLDGIVQIFDVNNLSNPLSFNDPTTGLTIDWMQRGTTMPPTVSINTACTSYQAVINFGPNTLHICADVKLNGQLIGPAQVCIPRGPLPANSSVNVFRCSAIGPGGCPRGENGNAAPGLCCVQLPSNSLGDPICAEADHFSSIVLTNDAKDADFDFVPDLVDNCPTVANGFGQNADADGDGVGDACDNCSRFNPDQYDANHNGIGDACEASGAQAVPMPPVGSGVLALGLAALGVALTSRRSRRHG